MMFVFWLNKKSLWLFVDPHFGDIFPLNFLQIIWPCVTILGGHVSAQGWMLGNQLSIWGTSGNLTGGIGFSRRRGAYLLVQRGRPAAWSGAGGVVWAERVEAGMSSLRRPLEIFLGRASWILREEERKRRDSGGAWGRVFLGAWGELRGKTRRSFG